MRNFIIAVALLLGVIFIFSQLGEVQAILDTLQRGDIRFILLALLIEGVWMMNVAAVYRAIYRALGLEEKIARLVLLAVAANFVNIIAPSAGMGGMAVFITDARRRGRPSAHVAIAGVLFVLFDYAAFFCVLALGLIVLFRRNNLNIPELSASAVLLLIALVMAVLIFLGMKSEEALGKALAWIARLFNRLLHPFIHRNYLSESRAHSFAHNVAGALHALRRKPENLLMPLALALSSKALLISILFMSFMVFSVPFSVGTLVAGFSIGYLFLIVSPTPAGLGVVEGALTLALTTLRVPLGAAAVVTLAYRGITFWVPLLVGMIAFRYLARQGNGSPAAQENSEPDP